jgi:MFS transporter, ACS family, DAL5 transporter family protein
MQHWHKLLSTVDLYSGSMGYSSLASQALSAPPYLVAFFAVLITASLSDRDRVRSPYLIIHALLSAVAYLTIGVTGHFHSYIPPITHILIRYVFIYPAVSGFFSAITLIITWTMDNRPSHEGKGTGIAILNTIGQFGPLVGTRLYPTSDGPWYVRGMLACSCFMLFVAVLAFVLRVLLQRENRRIPEAGIEIELEIGEGERDGLMGHHRSAREMPGAGTQPSVTYHIL